MTQKELATKLNLTDKAISKWERGEGVPDVYILKEMANIFGVSVSVLLDEENAKSPKTFIYTKRKSVLFMYAIALVMAIATISYVTFSMIFPKVDWFYLMFIYALPVASFVICILNKKWNIPVVSIIFQSTLTWTLALSIYLTFHKFLFILKDYYVFFAAGALQVTLLLWYFRHKKLSKQGETKNENDN